MSPRGALVLAGALAACDEDRPPPSSQRDGAPALDPPVFVDATARVDLVVREAAADAPPDSVLRGFEQCNGADDDGDGLVDEEPCPDSYPCANPDRCTCGALRTRCATECATLSTSRANCGRCGRACAASQECVTGACVAACPEGSLRCDALCVDVLANPEHCGHCERQCGVGVACVAGACEGREVFPPSGARLGTRRPELRWSSPGTAVLCDSARCEPPLATLGDATARSARVPERLAPGVYFWRAQGSATARPFRIDARDAATPGLVPSAPDLNADGLADVIVGCSRRLMVWLGRRAPLPERPDHTPPLPMLASPLLGAAGDLDGDVYGDVVAHLPATVLLTGSASDRAPTVMGLALPTGVPAGDLDGDGRVDWLGFGPPATAILASSRVPLMLPAAPSSPLAATAVGDVNGDGYDDLAIGAPDLTPPRAYLIAGSASGSLRGVALPPSPRTTGYGRTVDTAGDVNGDGFADLLVGIAPLGAVVYTGAREGAAVHRVLVGASDEELLVAAAGDVDGDGFSDVIAVVRARAEARLYRGGRAGLAESPVVLRDARWAAVESLGAPGDVDGDGFDDVVAGAPSAGTVYVLHGAPTEPLTRAETLRGDALEECGRAVL